MFRRACLRLEGLSKKPSTVTSWRIPFQPKPKALIKVETLPSDFEKRLRQSMTKSELAAEALREQNTKREQHVKEMMHAETHNLTNEEHQHIAKGYNRYYHKGTVKDDTAARDCLSEYVPLDAYPKPNYHKPSEVSVGSATPATSKFSHVRISRVGDGSAGED